MKKITEKYRRYNKTKIKRSFRKKYRNRAFRRKRSQHGYETRSIKYFKEFSKPKKAGIDTSIFNIEARFNINSSDVDGIKNLLILLKLAQSCIKKNYIKQVRFDFSKVTSIDSSAICVILSLVEELSFHKVDVTGNIPNDPITREVFTKSGFFAHVRNINGNRFETESEIQNTLVKIGRSDTDQEYMGREIKKAIEFLTGEKNHFEPVFSILVELSGNSIEHAFGGKSHWFLSINYDKIMNKVSFTFADNGQGIIKTLKRKYIEIIEKLTLKNDGDVLTRAFDRKYGSRHEEQLNRNRGLPMVKKYGKYVNNFKVITNGVILQIGNGYRLISPNYKGTFYQFEIDRDCIERWKNKLN